MNLKKRALYNALRMNWLIDPSIDSKSWQVENYREMSDSLLFSKLRQHDLDFDKSQFCSIAEDYDTPEELVDRLLEDQPITPEDEDLIYLLIFELWRRLETDKPCLSVFCDELDHQIFLHDHNQTQNVEEIQDTLSNLQVILDENVDQGADPIAVLHFVNEGCANDIETFLYDFITDQIDNDNFSYASELLDSFIDYVDDDKWFEFLRIRILTHTDPQVAKELIEQIADEALEEEDLQYNLELLSEMIQEGEPDTFTSLVTHSSELINSEEDFQDLLAICLDYYSCQDLESQEKAIYTLLINRSEKNLLESCDQNDEDLKNLLKIIC